MSELTSEAESIHETFSDHLDITVSDVQAQLSELINEYDVPMNEATRAVRGSLQDEAGLDNGDIQSSNDQVLVNDIDEDGQWVDVTVKVVELWEPRSESVSQVGLVGDESGRDKFISFETSDLEDLEEGESYDLKNVVTDEYEGDYSIKLNRTTEITKLDRDVFVGDQSTTISGSIVDLQSGTGLIERCSEDDCRNTLKNGMCSDHGDVDGEDDLRIMAILDTGVDTKTVVFNREVTTDLTGISLEEALTHAKDKLDRSVVADSFVEKVVGKYYTITGPVLGDLLIVNEYDTTLSSTHPEELLIKARSL